MKSSGENCWEASTWSAAPPDFQNKPADAIAQAERALKIFGQAPADALAEADYKRGVAYALTQDKRKGVELCRRAIAEAEGALQPVVVNAARLALARALFSTGDLKGATAISRECQAAFRHSGQMDSELRAWLVLGAIQRSTTADSTEAKAAATELVARMEQSWGAEQCRSYLRRPDVRAGWLEAFGQEPR